jgi:hypothetical protein
VRRLGKTVARAFAASLEAQGAKLAEIAKSLGIKPNSK